MSGEPDDDPFLRRWSRRKRGAAGERADTARPAAGEAGAPVPPERLSEAERERLIAELPDIDSLDETSDFTAFLRQGVPEELRRRALRRLWRLNPVFANLDGLNDYDLDYSNSATVIGNLKSAWQVGKGYAARDDTPAEPGREGQAAPGAACSPHSAAGLPAAEREEAGSGDAPDAPPRQEAGQVEEPEGHPPAAPAGGRSRAEAEPSRRSPGTAARRRWGDISG